MNVLCIDVGNSNTRIAVVNKEGVVRIEKFQTAKISMPGNEMTVIIDKLISGSGVVGVSFCSVVPGIYAHLLKNLRIFTTSLFNLSYKNCVGLDIHYPNPSEIGQDRLANAIGAQSRYGTPAIVVDMGTAVTLDIISADGAYEGGVIAPGLALMSHYLHEKTALLPEVDPADWAVVPLVGKSTKEAISIGCRRGFEGMIGAILKPVYDDLREKSGKAPHLISAGGDASFLNNQQFEGLIHDEDITLFGLFESFRRNLAK